MPLPTGPSILPPYRSLVNFIIAVICCYVKRSVVNKLQIPAPRKKASGTPVPEAFSPLGMDRLFHAAPSAPVGKLAVGQIDAILGQAGRLPDRFKGRFGEGFFVRKLGRAKAADIEKRQLALRQPYTWCGRPQYPP